jgi:hypothetical protein
VPAICTVTTGNTAGDAAVSIYLATIPANTAVTINYTATISNPLLFQVVTLSNQGYAAGANAAAIASDDPATAENEDATTVALTMGKIRGVAWFDNKDGIKQVGELGIPQVSVTLEFTDTFGQLQQASTNTDANGLYTFTVLAAGDYRVGFGLNEGYSYSPAWGTGKGCAVVMLSAAKHLVGDARCSESIRTATVRKQAWPWLSCPPSRSGLGDGSYSLTSPYALRVAFMRFTVRRATATGQSISYRSARKRPPRGNRDLFKLGDSVWNTTATKCAKVTKSACANLLNWECGIVGGVFRIPHATITL